MVVGFLLSRMLEEQFKRTLVISRGSLATFVDSPFTVSLLLIALLVLGAAVWSLAQGRADPSVTTA